MFYLLPIIIIYHLLHTMITRFLFDSLLQFQYSTQQNKVSSYHEYIRIASPKIIYINEI